MFRRPSRGRRFRRPRRRSFRPFVSRVRHYVNIVARSVTANTDDSVVTLLTAADAPTTSNVSDGTTIAACENNSTITGRLYFKGNLNASAGSPNTVDIYLFKDSAFGGVTDPTNGRSVVLVPATTAVLQAQKRQTIYFRRIIFTNNNDVQDLTIRIPRKILKDGESIKMIVSHLTVTGGNLTFNLNGSFVSKC